MSAILRFSEDDTPRLFLFPGISRAQTQGQLSPNGNQPFEFAHPERHRLVGDLEHADGYFAYPIFLVDIPARTQNFSFMFLRNSRITIVPYLLADGFTEKETEYEQTPYHRLEITLDNFWQGSLHTWYENVLGGASASLAPDGLIPARAGSICQFNYSQLGVINGRWRASLMMTPVEIDGLGNFINNFPPTIEVISNPTKINFV